MTQEPITPVVRLQFSGGLSAEEGRRLAAITSATRDPAEVFRHVLMAFRVFTIRDVKERLARNEIELTTQGVAGALDAAWVLFAPQMTPLASPMVGQAYLSAVRAVNGDIPPDVIAELSREHVLRVGRYFHESSREALVSGFSIYVNRRIPPRVALERALRGYGLTTRQMVGMTSIKDDLKVESMQPMNLEAKIQAYIGKALHQRFSIFARQEAHNLTNQANQVAWLWLVEHGQMNPETEKIWITAKDEKVCAICGPLHGKVVPITEQFPVPGGSLWVPGAHTNCRCWVRIRTPLGNLSIAKSMYGISYPEVTHEWVETEHPRGEGGRWTDKPHHHTKPHLKTLERSVDEEFMSLVSQVQAPELPRVLPPLPMAATALFTPMAQGQAFPSLTLTQVPDLELQRLDTLDLVQATAQEVADAAMVSGVTLGDVEAVNPKVNWDELRDQLKSVDTTPDIDHVYAVVDRDVDLAPGKPHLMRPTKFFYGPDARQKAHEAAALIFEKKKEQTIEKVENNAIAVHRDGEVYEFHTEDGDRLLMSETDISNMVKRMALGYERDDFLSTHNGPNISSLEAAAALGITTDDVAVTILKLETPREIKETAAWVGPTKIYPRKIGGPVEVIDDTAWRDPQETDDAHAPWKREITLRRYDHKYPPKAE